MDRTVVKGLKKSATLVGYLHRVILDAEGNVVAGEHRKAADPSWPSEVHAKIKTEKDRVLVKIHENYRKRMSNLKVKAELIKLAEVLVEDGIPEHEVCLIIQDLVPYTRSYVYKLLPSRYKREYGKSTSGQLPEGVFDVILADPPWEYEFSETDNRSINVHYSTMSLKDICELKVPSAKDSTLFLWATNPKVEEALTVMNAWGFSYRSNMVWVKDKIGMGYYVRSQHELLLVGRKGDMSVPVEANRPPSVLNSPRREHSKKPVEVYELIERMFPQGNYLELFARPEEQRKGWVYWGDEAS